MESLAPAPTFRKDYQAPDYLIATVDLEFDLEEHGTRVVSRIAFEANPHKTGRAAELVLNGENLVLESVALDGKVLTTQDYRLDGASLIILNPPERFQLECVTRIHPEKNTALEGLYKSSGAFCTQCEPQGFRKITYFLDRPDVMAIFTVTVRADKAKYPFLLSNGNRISTRDLAGGRHEVTWNDPFRKPCYLFALVAGDYDRVQDHFVTRSGRKVLLELYVNRGKLDRTAHAMASLKRAMKWDEERFGLEYDLDIFMIVAVDDFNFGAMENKGLNIFNSRLVLANPATATDEEYRSIEAVVGHEYFHNWSGNRVTCRDWFQLSLKEGLTVYRDQEFTSDMTSRGVTRIHGVSTLRSRQFAEDAGPMAHPIRPESYIQINNFYTATVYEKGAEVIRMLETILGRDRFHLGIDEYFRRHDGQAATCDDFVAAMEKGSGEDLTQFRLWYSQAGTPQLEVAGTYDAAAQTYQLTVAQTCSATPGQPAKKPFQLPLSLALLDSAGKEVVSRVLSIRHPEETFVFPGLRERPVPSLLRGFSAPVSLRFPYSESDLLFLLRKDGDAFSRWEAAQKLATKMIAERVQAKIVGSTAEFSSVAIQAYGEVLREAQLDAATRAEVLQLPAQEYLDQVLPPFSGVGAIWPDVFHAAASSLRERLGREHEAALQNIYHDLQQTKPYRYDTSQVGARALKNTALHYLCQGGRNLKLALEQLKQASNHTDEVAALAVLSEVSGSEREEGVQLFADRWKGDPLVIAKWFRIQAMSPVAGGLERVQKLLKEPFFQLGNPTHCYAALGAFAAKNPVHFHRLDGEGYRFLADFVLEMDARNPSVAARLVGNFNAWRRYEPRRASLMQAQLERILRQKLSNGVYEIVTKALA